MNLTDIKVGLFLAIRQLKRASLWTTLLIIFVMILTFLNLVVISGLLVGLIEGSVVANKEYYTGDIIISKLQSEAYIENTPAVIKVLEGIPEIDKFVPRYIQGVTLEANYQTRTDLTKDPNTAGASAAGIDPVKEDEMTKLADFIVEGEYLESDDYDKVLLGSLLIKRYLSFDSPFFTALDNVSVGSKIKVTIGSSTREVIVKGILKSKVDEIQSRIYFVEDQFRNLIGRTDYNVDEIVIRLKPGADPVAVKRIIVAHGIDKVAKVQTFEEAIPKFLEDIKATFALLGTIISSIGLAVASITVFIVIFINAITRRKFIGISKAIGISGAAIEFSYVIQSFFYALVGSVIGTALLYLILQPYINANPIDFPFSDGILVAPFFETIVRIIVLMIITMIAGYIPARIIVRKNTLDAILGR